MKDTIQIPELHPEILEKDGRKEFVVLPYDEYEQIQALLEDVEDLMDLRAAKASDESGPAVSLAEARRRTGA